jgi:hypothetical protein
MTLPFYYIAEAEITGAATVFLNCSATPEERSSIKFGNFQIKSAVNAQHKIINPSDLQSKKFFSYRETAS